MGCCGTEVKDNSLEMEGDDKTLDEEPKGKYGRKVKFDPSFKGPIKDRSCTDIICCILFLVMLLAMAIVGILGFSWGDPYKLLYPTDSLGNLCGTGDFGERPNLFFFDFLECIPEDVTSMLSITGCPTHQVCVKDCPSKNTLYSLPTTSKTDLICKYHIQSTLNTTTRSKADLVTSGDCAKFTIESQSLANRCIPTAVGDKLKGWLEENGDKVTTNGRNLSEESLKNGTVAQTVLMNLSNVGKRILTDIGTSWKWILAAFGICMVVSFLYIVILRWVAGILVWLTTYAVLTLLGFTVYYCFTEYKRLAALDNSDIAFDFVTNLSSYQEKKETWLAGGIISATVLGILLLILLALRDRIVIAIELIKQGSKAISAMLSTLVFPIIPWLLQLVLFAWFVAVLAFLSTSGTGEYREIFANGTVSDVACKAADALNQMLNLNESDSLSCNLQQYNTDDNVFRLQVFHLFGWFWIMNFIIALGQCVLAGAFASWYWAWDKKKDVPTFPIFAAFYRTLRYHTGTLAFGSLIIAIIQMIRVLLEYIEYKLKQGPDPGPIINFILKCMKCVFWCLEKFMKFINKNAYIEVAVYGKNFCVSAKNAFFLLMRNILRVAVLNNVTSFLLFTGKLSITAAMGVASFYFFEKDKSLNYYLTPVIIIIISAWVVASAFFGVYDMAIDTVFLCFLEDSERHDGSAEKPYYMSKKLKKVLGKKNKVPDDEE